MRCVMYILGKMGEREREPVIINMKIAFCVSFVRLFYVIRMDRPNYFCFTPVNYAREWCGSGWTFVCVVIAVLFVALITSFPSLRFVCASLTNNCARCLLYSTHALSINTQNWMRRSFWCLNITNREKKRNNLTNMFWGECVLGMRSQEGK